MFPTCCWQARTAGSRWCGSGRRLPDDRPESVAGARARLIYDGDLAEVVELDGARVVLRNHRTAGFVTVKLGRLVAQARPAHPQPTTEDVPALAVAWNGLTDAQRAAVKERADIAAELGVLDVTVIAAARRHGIPSRPPGVHSRPEMITMPGGHVPPGRRRRPARLAPAAALPGRHDLPHHRSSSHLPRRPPVRARPPVPPARTRHRRQALPTLRPRPAHAASAARRRAPERT